MPYPTYRGRCTEGTTEGTVELAPSSGLALLAWKSITQTDWRATCIVLQFNHFLALSVSCHAVSAVNHDLFFTQSVH